MDDFVLLVQKQMQTMEHLLFLHEELDKSKKLEIRYLEKNDDVQLLLLRKEIDVMRSEIVKIQSSFDHDTKKIIESFEHSNLSKRTSLA